MKTSIHHSFDIRTAMEHGIEEAILIHHFQFWIMLNKRQGKNSHDGRTWMFDTQKRLTAHFPYWKNRLKVMRLIDSLVEKKILIKGNYNKRAMDRTCWYAFVEEEKYLGGWQPEPELFEPEKEDVEDEQCNVQNRTMECSKVNTPLFGSEPALPDTTQDTTPDKKTPPTPSKGERANARSVSGSSSEKKSFGEEGHVKLTVEEHWKLFEKYGGTRLTALIEELNDYLGSTGKRYKSHYHTLKQWHRRKDDEPSAVDTPEKNKTYAQQIADNFNPVRCRQVGCRIDVLNQQVEIVASQGNYVPFVLKYSEKGFKDQLDNALHKWRLK